MPAPQQAMLHIDLASIPDFRREALAKGALELMEQVFSVPGALSSMAQRAQGQTKTGGQSCQEKGVILCSIMYALTAALTLILVNGVIVTGKIERTPPMPRGRPQWKIGLSLIQG